MTGLAQMCESLVEIYLLLRGGSGSFPSDSIHSWKKMGLIHCCLQTLNAVSRFRSTFGKNKDIDCSKARSQIQADQQAEASRWAMFAVAVK